MSAKARRAVRGRVVVRVREGRALEHIHTHRDVRLGAASAALAIDRGGRIDRVLRRYSSAMLVTRAFSARNGVLSRSPGHLAWDDVERKLGLSRTLRVRVDPNVEMASMLEDLRALEGVEMVTPEYLATTPDDEAHPLDPQAEDDGAAFDDTTADPMREMIRADEAIEAEPGDSSLILGLVDSGVNLEHPELTGRLRPGISSVGIHSDSVDDDDLTLIDGARADLQDVDDDQGHGTTCASLISANGFRMRRGLAGASRLLPIRALCGARIRGRRKPTAIGTLPDIDSGLKTAIDLHARVINLSFGTPETALGPNTPVPHVEIVRYALARDCVLVAASGNSGSTERYFPAALPGVIAVGAVDALRRPASFSTRGDHVSLCAPGLGVRAARLRGYAAVSGTSFAAPLVAAACALLLSRSARLSVPLPPEVLQQILRETATPFGQHDVEGCGAGVLDVVAALHAVDRWSALRTEAG